MIQKLKICAGCGKPKHIWKNVDGKKYCQQCSKGLVKPSPIKSISPALSKKEQAYSVLRKAYLKHHPMCEAHLSGCTSNATEVHHMQGRGPFLLHTLTWLAVCRNCHQWIEMNPELAKEMEFSKSRLKN